jgi:hypothetical protein
MFPDPQSSCAAFSLSVQEGSIAALAMARAATAKALRRDLDLFIVLDNWFY